MRFVWCARVYVCRILIALLAPDGLLLRAASKVDSELQLKFIFPSERLPAKTQILLRSGEGCQALSLLPHYTGALSMVNAQAGYELHTSVLGYYFLWFSYYVMKRSSAQVAIGSSMWSPMAGTNQWGGIGSPFQNFAASRAPDVLYTKTGTGRRHAYLELVLTYLKCYIASPDKVAPSLSTKFAASAAAAARLIDGDGMPHGGRERASASPFSRGHQMYRPTGSFGDSTSSLKASAEYDGTRGSNTLFFATVIDAWLSEFVKPDGATENVGQGQRQSSNGHFGSGYLVASYQPPPEDLLASLRMVIKYLIDPNDEMGAGCGPLYSAKAAPSSPLIRINQPSAQKKKPPAPAKRSMTEINDSICIIRKPVYAMLRGAFQQWPSDSQARMTPLVDVLMAFIAPWATVSSSGSSSNAAKTPPKDSLAGHFSSVVGRAAGSGMNAQQSANLDQRWVSYVSENIPFYSILIESFLSLQYRRAAMFPDSVARQIKKVLGQIAKYPQVAQLVSDAEHAYNSDLGVSGSTDGSPRGNPSAAAQKVIAQVAELEGSSGTHTVSLALFSENMHGGGAGLAAAILQSLQAACRNGKLERRRLDDAQDACINFFGHRLHPTSHVDGIGSPQSPASPFAPDDGMYRDGEGEASLRRRQTGADVDAGTTMRTAGILPKGSWKDIKYKGDWMRRREVGQDEIPLLTFFFVDLSTRINAMSFMRTRGWTVNLRPLGEIQSVRFFVAVFLLFALLCYALSHISFTDGDDYYGYDHYQHHRSYGNANRYDQYGRDRGGYPGY